MDFEIFHTFQKIQYSQLQLVVQSFRSYEIEKYLKRESITVHRALYNEIQPNKSGELPGHAIRPPLTIKRCKGFLLRYFEVLATTLCRRYYLPASLGLQPYGNPPNWATDVRRNLDTKLLQRWIGMVGPIIWLTRSPDLALLDIFMWGYVRAYIFSGQIKSQSQMKIWFAQAVAAERTETLCNCGKISVIELIILQWLMVERVNSITFE